MKTSAQEECGVWLDTVQLKEKSKQKRLARPIYKLLNPSAEGGGYSLAVALNFTQTKMEMPKTKQSSISSFFTPQRRVINKMSTSQAPKMHTGKSFSPTSAAPTLVSSGNKRKRVTGLENSDMYNFESPVDHGWINENVSEADVAVWQEQDKASRTPFQHMYSESKEEQSEEFSVPHSKRKFSDSSVASDCQPLLQAWSQDPLFSSSQYTDSEFSLSNKKNTPVKNANDAEPSFLNSLQSLEAFGLRKDLEEKTSTQKHFHSSQMDGEKENSRSLYSNSPNKHSFFSHPGPLSNHKWTQPKIPSPQKLSTKQQWRKADNEKGCNSPAKWTKLRSSPLKQALQQQCNETEEDTLAMLFTQDSEGLRVIAHRGLLPRSPLKDQSNVTTGIVRTSIYKSLVEDDEEYELLFTQDSQGNVVIKH